MDVELSDSFRLIVCVVRGPGESRQVKGTAPIPAAGLRRLRMTPNRNDYLVQIMTAVAVEVAAPWVPVIVHETAKPSAPAAQSPAPATV